MTLLQFNEAYREMIDSGRFSPYISPAGQIRLKRRGYIYGDTLTLCPLNSLAKDRGNMDFLVGFQRAGEYLGLPYSVMLYIAQTADHPNNPNLIDACQRNAGYLSYERWA